MSDVPSTNGDNGAGRETGGRFAKGNAGGPGNPHAAKVAKLRTALLDAVKPGDVEGIVAALLLAARGGDVAASRELLNRLLGPPVEHDLIERLERLEASNAERNKL